MKHFRYRWILLGIAWVLALPVTGMTAETADDTCIKCHRKVSPGQVEDWQASKHSGETLSGDI